MRKTILALLTAVAVFAYALPAHSETLRLTASAWPPYVDPTTRASGFAIALVSTALERAGYELAFTAEPWPKALEATVAGKYDVVGALWFQEERGESLAFSEPYIDCEIALIKLTTSDFRFTGRDSLVGRKVGVVDDYAYSREAVDRTGIEIVSGGTVTDNVARLADGEIDLVVADRRVALFHINEGARAKMFDVLPDALMRRGLRIAVPKSRPDHEEIIAAFDTAVAEMRADGTYDALLASFRVSTW